MTRNKYQNLVSAENGPLDRAWPCAAPAVLFLAMTAQSRIFAVIAGALFLVFSLGPAAETRLRSRAIPLVIAAAAYAAVSLIAGLRPDFGDSAAKETGKILTALAVMGMTLARDRSVKSILLRLDAVIAAAAFLCVDGSSLGLAVRGFVKLMSLLGSEYSIGTMGYENGVRITGLYSNPNISAGIIALGLVISLYLIRTAPERRKRPLLFLMLGVESLAFLLSFSMGAMAAFALTAVIYIAASAREDRLPLFLLMLGAAFSSVVCAFAAYPFLGKSGAVSAVPDAAAVACGGLIWLLDGLAAKRAPSGGKTLKTTAAALALLAVVYAALSVTVTSGAAIGRGETLQRAAYLKPGAYTVAASGTAHTVKIYSQNEKDLMMHTRSELFGGALDGASFTVPEDSRVVWLYISGEGRVDSASLSGIRLKLGYPLLPGFAANRLQGLFANQNFIQRLVFFRDGIALWLKSPVFGWGLGGVEGRLTSVQGFYYETKYIHNQFIQIMDEAGIIGLAALLALLGAALKALSGMRGRRKDGVSPLFAACITMMTAHSLTEIVWSTQMYQTAVFTIFAAMAVSLRDEPAAAPAPKKASGTAAAAAVRAFCAVFAVLLLGNLTAASRFNSGVKFSSNAQAMAFMQEMDRLDVYGDAAYKVNYMAEALSENNSAGRAAAAKTAAQLRRRNEFNACRDVAVHYDLPLKNTSDFFADCRAAIAQEASNPDAWNVIVNLYKKSVTSFGKDKMEDFAAGAAETLQRLDSFNEGRMGPITLTEQNLAYLKLCASLRGSGNDAIYTALSAVKD